MMQLGEMTARQRQVLEILASRQWRSGAPLNDLAREMAMSGESAVRFHVDSLQRLGLVERRGLSERFKPAFITEAGLRALGLKADVSAAETIVEPDARRLLREFELVHAGEVGVEFEAAPRLVTLEGRLGVRPGEDYLLPVAGTCMMPVFREGDVVIMRADERPEDGSLVHVDVRLSGDAWEPLLRVFRASESEGMVWLTHLHPERSTIQVPGEEICVRGRFVGFWREARSAYDMLREIERAEAVAPDSAQVLAPATKRAVGQAARSAKAGPARANASLNCNVVRR